MNKRDYMKMLQTDEKELIAYMERSKWHVLKVTELDAENKRLRAVLKHLKVHGELLQALLDTELGT